MSRAMTFIIILILLIAGALYLLSSRASEVPTKTVEVAVEAPANGS